MKKTLTLFFVIFQLILFAQSPIESQMKNCFLKSDYKCVIELGNQYVEENDSLSSESLEFFIMALFEEKFFSDVWYFCELKKEKFNLSNDEKFRLAISFHQLGKCDHFENIVSQLEEFKPNEKNEISKRLKNCDRQLPNDKATYSLIETIEVKENYLVPILKRGKHIYYNFNHPKWANSCLPDDRKRPNGIYLQDISNDGEFVKLIDNYFLLDIQNEKIIVCNEGNQKFIGEINGYKIQNLKALPLKFEVGNICFTDREDVFYITKSNENFNSDIYKLNITNGSTTSVEEINTLGEEINPYMYKGKLFFSSNFRPSKNENFDLYCFSFDSNKKLKLVRLNNQLNSIEDESKILEITEETISIFREDSKWGTVNIYKRN